jgi:hypothetical protein
MITDAKLERTLVLHDSSAETTHIAALLLSLFFQVVVLGLANRSAGGGSLYE